MAGLHKYTVQESLNAGLGQAGYKYIDDDETYNSGTVVAITSLGSTSGSGSATITATSANSTLWDDLSGIELIAGITIFGRWTSVHVASGEAAILYKG